MTARMVLLVVAGLVTGFVAYLVLAVWTFTDRGPLIDLEERPPTTFAPATVAPAVVYDDHPEEVADG